MRRHPVLSRMTAAGVLLIALYSPVLAFGSLLPGSTSEAETQVTPPSVVSLEEIERRITALSEERAALAQQIEQTEGSESSQAVRNLVRSMEKLEHIDRILDTQAGIAKNLAVTSSSGSESIPADVPSIFTLNALYEQKAAADLILVEKRSGLEAAKEQLETLSTRSRAAKIALEKSTPKNRERNERAAQSAALAVRVQAEQVNLISLEVQQALADVARGNTLEARIEAVRLALASEAGEPGKAINPLVEREIALQRDKTIAERHLATVELRLSAEKQRYASSPQTSGEALAVVEALTAYQDAVGKQVSLAASELDRLASLRDTWSHWDALLRSRYAADELPAWKELADAQLNDLRLADSLRQRQMSDLQVRLESLESRASHLPSTSQVRVVLQESNKVLRELHSELLATDRQAEVDQRLIERFMEDIDTVTGNVGFFEYVNRAVKEIRSLWNFEITTIDDAPFTLGSLTIGLLLFVSGLWLSRLGASMVGRVAAKRLMLDHGAVQAMETFSFYALLIGFTLLALNAVHFPLTAFAFLGGALAIGIGFGSQNVMNNFISGLILMLERPVRAQDVVEVDGSHGVIQKIGPRSTHIRSTDGRHIVVPNSFFLESNVVNWTLSDDLMRDKVSVGVSYGSPTRLVKQLIEDVMKAEPLVLNDPAPKVIFAAFGDSALNFDVYFWVQARSPMSIRDVQSKIRFAIDDVFREHHLVIAYPQRDVHLDSLAPVEVRLVDGVKSETASLKPSSE